MENEKGEETVTVTAMPANIKTASYLIYASVTVCLASIFIFDKVDVIPFIAVSFVLFLLFCRLGYLVGQGRGWARTLWLALSLYGLARYSFTIKGDFDMSFAYGISSTLTTALDLLVLVLLYTGETNRWYKENRLEQHS